MSSTVGYSFQPHNSQSSYVLVSTIETSEYDSPAVNKVSSAVSEKEREDGHLKGDILDSHTTLLDAEDGNLDGSRSRLVQYCIRQTIRSVKSRLPTGWRFGAWFAMFQASFVLLINITILILSAIYTGGVIGVAFEGNCDTVERYSIGIHLIINVLSTALLGASNYTMQILCAPTRADIDRAHEKGIWLDIGLQSFRNLRYTSRQKQMLWAALFISSIPLHLFYNSSFFLTLNANGYLVSPASGPDLQTLVPYADGRYAWNCGWPACPAGTSELILPLWDVLLPADCIKAYATDFVSDRGSVVVVAGAYDGASLLSPFLHDPFFGVVEGVDGDPFAWICSGMTNFGKEGGPELCSVAWKSIDPSDWNYGPDALKVNYCISQPIVPKCQLNFNLPLLAVVIAFNIIKVICMTYSAIKIRDNPLVTIGDGIASFVSNPDIHTRDMCLAGSDFFNGRTIGETLCLEYQPRRIRWLHAASKRQWIMTASLFAGAISALAGLLIHGVIFLYSNGIIGPSGLWEFGLGKPHALDIMVENLGYIGLLISVLVSNSPQLVLSIIYLFFNSLCTKTCLAREWSVYAHSRKPLRVSSPRGDQRSTYFLQIPYRFGLPLMAYLAVLHWLTSESLFPVQINYYYPYNSEAAAPDSYSSCGFSAIGLIFTLIVGTTLILGVFIIAFSTHLNGDIPLVGSCSAAISASCHPPIPDGSDSLKPLKWGAVVGAEDDVTQTNRGGVGHVCFSSGVIVEPIPGCCYS
ncbi:hypothetical protein D9757_012166 [Collybiopsis confluens]|uniref:DUF6536 domain-containing protein n=1 Tax=Collybiopsis confluens TaxID=2823264 RepID=A0A8H5GKP6_9AGAR|nr:hypothetical protein D9757_012166 [Collybiopsis confluens]